MSETSGEWRKNKVFASIWESVWGADSPEKTGRTRTQLRDELKSDMADICAALIQLMETGMVCSTSIPQRKGKDLHVYFPGPRAARKVKATDLKTPTVEDETPAPVKAEPREQCPLHEQCIAAAGHRGRCHWYEEGKAGLQWFPKEDR